MRKFIMMIVGCVLLVSAVVLFLSQWKKRGASNDSIADTPAPVGPATPPEFVPPPKEETVVADDQEYVGEGIMGEYLAESGSARKDLVLVSRLLLSFRTLVKADDALPLGANGDIADAVRGKNPFKMAFLPPGHRAFNGDGEIIDRWQTPLYFHAQSSELIEIRSAGPDQAMWTDDDIQLNADGRSFAEVQ